MYTTEIIDCIKANEDKSIYVRTSVNTFEDGVLIDFKFRQKVVNPGDDYSAEDAKVQAIAASVHTAEVIAAYKAAQALAQVSEIPA